MMMMMMVKKTGKNEEKKISGWFDAGFVVNWFFFLVTKERKNAIIC